MKSVAVISLSLISMQLCFSQKIDHKNLEFTDGSFYIKSTGELFSGKAYGYHPNGEIEIISNIKNGKQHGKRKMFWNSGNKFGIVFEDENFNNYKRVKFWNEDGTISFQGKYIDGKLYKKGSKTPFDGKSIGYYENGQISVESEFKNGMWHGTQIRYSRDGKIKSKCYFENNKIVDCPIYQKKTEQ